MPTFKITVQKHQKRRDGKYPISIRLTHRKKIAYMATGYYAQQSDLTRSFEVKSPMYCQELNRRINEYEKLIVTLRDKINDMDVHQLVDYLKNSVSSGKSGIDFMKFARDTISKMEKEGKKQTNTYKSVLKNLETFLIEKNMAWLLMSEMTSSFLKKYEASISGVRAPSAYMAVIRAIFNMAREKYNDEDADIIRISNNPFRKYKVPEQNVAKKRGMDSINIRKIIECNPQGIRDELAKDVFFLSFCLVGTNSVDLYHCKYPVNGYIEYERQKTRETRKSDNAYIKIRVEPEILPLLEKYKDETGERAFNFYKRYSDHATFNTALNKGLKIIGKSIGIDKLQFYAARHSWAGIARNECGIQKSEVHEYLNHVDPDLKITDLYLQKDWLPLANANRKVIDRVLGL